MLREGWSDQRQHAAPQVVELVLINRLSKKECVDTFTSAKLACPSEIYSTLTDFEGKVSWQYTSRRSLKSLSAGGLTEEELNLLKHVRGTRSDSRARLSFLTRFTAQGERRRCRGTKGVPSFVHKRFLAETTQTFTLLGTLNTSGILEYTPWICKQNVHSYVFDL